MKRHTRRILALLLCFILLFTANAYAPFAPVHAAVTKQGETFEDVLISGIESLQTTINVAKFNIASSNFKTKFETFYTNNPQLFYLKGSYSYSMQNSIVQTVTLSYHYAKNDVLQMKEDLEREVQLALAQTSPTMSDLEKCLAIHDYLVLTTEYDEEGLDSGNISFESYTICGTLLNKTAVCESYAKTFQYLMKRLDVPCFYVSSESMNHAWNMVQLNGKYYHVDVTFDDPVRDQLGSVSHTNFLKSDWKMTNELDYHGWSSPFSATDTTYDNAFWNNIKSGMFYINQYWYYISSDKSIMKYRFSDNSTSTVYNNESLKNLKWFFWGSTSSFWTGTYVKLSAANGALFYNTPDSIFKILADGSNHERIATLDTSDGYIYGIAIKNGVFHLSMKKSPNDADRISTLPMDGISPPPLPTPSAKPTTAPTSKPVITTPSTPNPTPSQAPPVAKLTGPGKVSQLKYTIQSRKNKKYKLKWKKTKNSSGYEIFLSNKKNKSFKKVKTIKKANTTSYQSKLPKGKKAVYCKIRAYRTVKGKRITGTFSKIIKIRVGG